MFNSDVIRTSQNLGFLTKGGVIMRHQEILSGF